MPTARAATNTIQENDMNAHDTKAQALEPMQATELVTKLYQAVDTREAAALAPFLSPSVTFQLGNNPPVNGREAVLEINASFFTSIAGMAHTIDAIWSQGANIICNGSVRYTRFDGSHLSIPFATILTTERGLIHDYKVYADVSPL
jgi:ketosteroid isomerase-like protein